MAKRFGENQHQDRLLNKQWWRNTYIQAARKEQHSQQLAKSPSCMWTDPQHYRAPESQNRIRRQVAVLVWQWSQVSWDAWCSGLKPGQPQTRRLLILLRRGPGHMWWLQWAKTGNPSSSLLGVMGNHLYTWPSLILGVWWTTIAHGVALRHEWSNLARTQRPWRCISLDHSSF